MAVQDVAAILEKDHILAIDVVAVAKAAESALEGLEGNQR